MKLVLASVEVIITMKKDMQWEIDTLTLLQSMSENVCTTLKTSRVAAAVIVMRIATVINANAAKRIKGLLSNEEIISLARPQEATLAVLSLLAEKVVADGELINNLLLLMNAKKMLYHNKLSIYMTLRCNHSWLGTR